MSADQTPETQTVSTENARDRTEPVNPPVLVVAAGNVTVLPSQPASPDATVPPHGKRPDYTHRPKGAVMWVLLIPFLAAEVVALKLDVEWTLSRTIWWLLGPAHEPRWWLVGFPLWALLAWTGPHFLWPHVFGGWTLTVMVGVALVAAGIGTVLTLT